MLQFLRFVCACSFAIGIAGAQEVTVLYSFSGDIVEPLTTLVEVKPGVFWGSYPGGLFQITSAGAFTDLANFSGAYPAAGDGPLTPASNGLLYGVRSDLGQAGAVYGASVPRAESKIVNREVFAPGPVTGASDGNIWGAQGSDSGGYTVFRMSLDGTLTTVAGGQNGLTPGPLLEASDGNFYGSTYDYSSDFSGQLYRVTPSGELSVLYTFPIGEASYGGLMQASNGLLYGGASYYDYNDPNCPAPSSVLFTLSLTGEYQVLHEFRGCSYYAATVLGGGLLEGSDGNLYGTLGTPDDVCGAIFRIAPDGTGYSNIAQFLGYGGVCSPGSFGPSLTEGSDGQFYGASGSGGTDQQGTVYKVNVNLSPPLPSVKFMEPSTGTPGTTIRLTGNYLLGLSAVSFNGTPATFTAVNVNYAYATVPAGATTGPITVTTMNGSFTTKKDFEVQ